MKVGIVTLPLKNNYGAFLQNWALQQAIRRCGHEPVTLDRVPALPLGEWVKLNAKALIRLPFPDRRRPFLPAPRQSRVGAFKRFAEERLALTPSFSRYSPNLIPANALDCVVAGSDQIWRPAFASSALEDLYLRFAQAAEVPAFTYGASFGCDEWEYTPEQEAACGNWIRKQQAVSVREESAVALCREHYGIRADRVVDPTLLLEASDYETLCGAVPRCEEPYLLSYVLDAGDDTDALVRDEAVRRKLKVKTIPTDVNARLGVQEWLAAFRDAAFVITDSYHGTIFSILFGKAYRCLRNSLRGNSRFDSLLSLTPETLETLKQASWHYLESNLSGKKA
jgi:hypothetical protein